jgi:pimeloyl-ACP methyl ester carboxylesterase
LSRAIPILPRAKNTVSRLAEWILAASGAALLIAGALLVSVERLPVRSIDIGDSCHTPVFVIDPPQQIYPRDKSVAWNTVVLHGLAANRRVMFPIGQELARAGATVYLLDLPGEGNSTEEFSFANNDRCAAVAVAALARSGALNLDRTVIVGHSLGGASAVYVARRLPRVAGTIALSPAPMVQLRHVPPNFLIESAQFDPPQLLAGARQLLASAGGLRDTPADFANRRAVGYAYESLALHGSVLFDPRVLRITAHWSRESVGASASPPIETYHEMLAIAGVGMGLVGIVMILPLSASSLCGAFGLAKSRGDSSGISDGLPAGQLFVRVAVCFGAAAALLIFGVPLRALHLYSADYVASLLSLSGLLLIVLLPVSLRVHARIDARSQCVSIVFALATMVAFGLWFNWQVTTFLPSGGRAWRLLPLALATWPFFAAEELALGSPSVSRRRARWLIFIGIRATLLAAMVLGYFGFANGVFLPILLSPFMLAISILQRWGSDLLRSRGGGAIAASTFNAILAAWFFAAVFPLQ